MFLINTLIVAKAQHNKGQQTSVLSQINDKSLFSCELGEDEVSFSKKALDIPLDRFDLGFQSFSKPKILKIAIVATGEYSQYFITKNNAENLSVLEKKTIVNSAIQKTLANSNIILRRDLGVELHLILDNEQLIFLDPDTDGLSGNNALLLISEITQKINAIIPQESYDLGQAFFTGTGGLSVVGGAFGNRKAQGVAGAKFPEGKVFDIDFFTHEIGHQLGATHTQNSNCSRDTTSSIEPGSGSTIMGYAGVCHLPNSNVRYTSDQYFHNYSILQIRSFLSTKIMDNLDLFPSYGLKEIPNYKIPKETPFEILLKTKTPRNSVITYSCNQTDKELVEFPPTSELQNGPVFSPQKLSSNATIYFPEKQVVLNGEHNSIRGVLSSIERTYNFMASARIEKDNQYLASVRSFEVEVVDIPAFKMNSQNKENLIWNPGAQESVTWVVGDTKQKLNVDYVDILLSDNNGLSFDYILATKIDNDGEQLITVPTNIESHNCRIKIKAHNSIFYTVNEKRFSITSYEEVIYQNKNELNFNDNVVSLIDVDKDLFFEDLEVSLDLEYTDVSKLKVKLIAPSGKELLLWDRSCSKGTDLAVRFKDDESKIPKGEFTAYEVCEPIILGFKAPEEVLRKLSNEETRGDWSLVIETNNNNKPGNSGKLKDWSLHFMIRGVRINKPDFAKIETVKIFPNPVKDKFSIQFVNTQTTHGILELYSVSGTLLRTEHLFTQENNRIGVENIPPGIYFLNIITEQRVINRKILIN